MTWSWAEDKAGGNCVRCGRALTDPNSVRRSMGPVCWAASCGDVFESDLTADDQEWARREEVLRRGGEIDLGANWQYVNPDPAIQFQVSRWMRVSVRFRDGAFEAYGAVAGLLFPAYEVVFARGTDLRAVYAAAVAAGPQSNARTHRVMRAQARRAKGRVAA